MPRKTKQEDELLSLRYVSLSELRRWERNAKKHDIPKIIVSLKQHGFKDPPKYEPTLNNGAGGIVEGNGRITALWTMYNQNKNDSPRGIGKNENGMWMVPVIFGVDAESQSAAEAYGVDHNTITLLGGFDPAATLKLWDDSIGNMLKDLQAANKMPVSISAEDLDSFFADKKEKLSEKEESIRPKTMLRILISCPPDMAIDIQDMIEKIRALPGIEVDTSGN